jgi:hypothetical protein
MLPGEVPIALENISMNSCASDRMLEAVENPE